MENVKWLVEVLSSPEAQASSILVQFIELCVIAAIALVGWAVRNALLAMEKERQRVAAIAEAARLEHEAFVSASKKVIFLDVSWFEPRGERIIPHIQFLDVLRLDAVVESEKIRGEIDAAANAKVLPHFGNPHCANVGLFELPSGIKRLLAPLKPFAQAAIAKSPEILRHLKAKRSSLATSDGTDYAVLFVHRDEYEEDGVVKYGKLRATVVALWQFEEILPSSADASQEEIAELATAWLEKMSANIPEETMTLDRPHHVAEAAVRYLRRASVKSDVCQVMLIKI